MSNRNEIKHFYVLLNNLDIYKLLNDTMTLELL